jgi:hypothetical protein
MKYRIYIDEVGNPDLESSSNPNHRFLSLTGVIIELGHVEKTIYPQMETLKARYFDSHPDDPVVFHRKEMVNCRPPFESLRDDEVRERFDSELLALMRLWEYRVISVCLDKKKHKDTYTTWRYDPYHYCLAVLLERFVIFLSRRRSTGDVMAESRGGKEDNRLKGSFTGLWENGTDYLSAEDFQKRLTSRELKIKPKSNNISGLQLADLLAHPSRNEILAEAGLLAKGIAPFASAVTEILQAKYDQQQGRMFGKKFI